jgi:hypothetical protein
MIRERQSVARAGNLPLNIIAKRMSKKMARPEEPGRGRLSRWSSISRGAKRLARLL